MGRWGTAARRPGDGGDPSAGTPGGCQEEWDGTSGEVGWRGGGVFWPHMRRERRVINK